MGNAVTAQQRQFSFPLKEKLFVTDFKYYCVSKKEENVLWTPCIPEAITVILLMCYELLF